VREPTAERGFTLIELMMVVAIIAVLAVIVVPQFTREAHKTKGKTEVSAMFAQLQTKEETYKQEAGAYLPAVGTTLQCPTSGPIKAGYNFATLMTDGTCAADWTTLRINPPESKMYCQYTIKTGAKTDELAPPLTFKNSQGLAGAETTLASSWWYLMAECDEDGQGGTNATYYASSVDPTLQILNSGN
jgi:prepilin-type N-terminal cleavage/methylation domain-containing protein